MYSANFHTYFQQLKAAFPPLVAIFAVCLPLGWSSPALQKLQLGDSNLGRPLTHDEGSLFISLITISEIPGTLAMMVSIDYFGRRLACILLLIPSFVAWMIFTFSTNIIIFYLGRVLAGMSVGMGVTLLPIYLGEIASKDFRGTLLTLLATIGNTVDPIIEFILTPLVSLTASAAISSVPSIMALFLMYWSYESPYYLVMKNKIPEARKCLENIRYKTVDNDKTITDELNEIERTIIAQTKNKASLHELFVVKSNRTAIIYMTIIHTIKSCVGLPIIRYFIHIVVEQLNLDLSANTVALTVMILTVLGSISSTIFVRKLGKTVLMIASLIGCFLSTLIIAIYFNFANKEEFWIQWIPVICLLVYAYMHGLGIVTLPYAYLGELFAANIKTYAVVFSKCYLALCYFVITSVFQSIFDYNNAYPFYFFAFSSFIGILFFKFVMPETDRKSFYEIQVLLGAKYDDVEGNL
ncbi:facilitated trehalose transporter Tret1-like [Chrysoperla carnea]|uniref:facilitated trehalose transporter Tret1-like n=1 Tax=Chrysoperla carnea TaxID=189513 RepID=UPI001D08C65C|nr:facilitated trehalose transporter Tret1-like [Chrysoperla carnea]